MISTLRTPMLRSRSTLTKIAAALVILAALPAFAVSPAANSVELTNSFKPVATTPGVNPYMTRSALNAQETEAVMDFEVALKMRNFANLQSRLARGEKISAQEMADKYLPSAADYQRVTNWAKSQGFTITRMDSRHVALFLNGKVSQIQKAMAVNFARVSFRNSEYTSAINAPYVPNWMSPLLVGVNGLQPHVHPLKHIKRPAAAGGGASYKPSQIAQAYNATSLYSSNITGAGESIAIVIDTFPATSDLVMFWNKTGVAQTLGNIHFTQAVAGQLPDPSGEETLDVEWASGLAPDAHVRVYASRSLTDANLDATYQAVLDDVTAHPEYGIHQMSMSYGEGETFVTSGQLQTDAQYYAQLTAAGVTCFASTGDEGSTPDASGGDSGPIQAESPATDPNVTAVGGTSLTLTASNNESTEVVWNNATGATGGGTSGHFARPSWQTGTGVNLAQKRQVPDISLTADPRLGAITYLSGSLSVVGGTSWSSPSLAAFCALMNQARANSSQGPLGLLGPYIYPLITTGRLRDITSGSNATANSGGRYAATVGFDQATGVGVPLMQSLTQAVTGSTTIVGVTPSDPIQEIAPNVNASFTVTVSGSSATYQWQREPIGSSTWSNLSNGGAYSGVTMDTLTITAATGAMSGDQFRCLVNLGTSIVTTNPSVLVVDRPLTVSTLAGFAGQTGSANGTSINARFAYPSGVAVNSLGNIFVADFSNNVIRQVTANGTVSTPFGSTSGFSGSTNGTGNNARFNTPNAVAVDSSDNIYVADTGNNLIRKISGTTVSTLAGTGNGFANPQGVAVDGAGNVYVADTSNHAIRKITSAGVVSTFAGAIGVSGSADGSTTSARFNNPSAVAVDGLGNVYVADFGNSTVRKISGGTVTTIAGQAGQAGYLDGLGTNTLFNAPIGLAVDDVGNLLITDCLVPPETSNASGNNLVRKLSTAGVVSTLAGDPGTAGTSNGTGSAARFYSVQAVAFKNATYYLADTYNQTIRSGIVSGKDAAQITLGNLAATYDGNAHAAAATTNPGGLPVTFTYNGSATVPVNAGSYNVVATVNTTDYSGTATGTLVIGKAVASVTITPSSLNTTYNGSGRFAVATTTPAGLSVSFTYNGSSALPVAVGSYAVVGTVNNANYTGSASGTLVINPGVAVVTLGALAFNYDGKTHGTTATTSPAKLPVTITYNGSATAPSAVGSYAVVATINSANYSGTANGTLVISPVLPLATTGAASLISATGATVSGTTNPKTSATTVSFQYGLTTAYGSTSGSQNAGSGLATVNVSAVIPVTPSTIAMVYHYRIVATNAAGTTLGADKAFTALAQPSIASAAQASLGASGSEVNLTVNPNGAATSVYFQFGTTTSYGSVTATQNLGSGKTAVNVFALFPDLQPSTTYHYRLVMTGTAGTFFGPDQTFTTLAFDTNLIAQKGDAATGTPTTFATFGNPAINLDDLVAFTATLTLTPGVTTANNAGIWTVDSSNVQHLIARTGSPAVGTAVTFATIGDPLTNDSGAITFKATLKGATTTTANGIWSTSSGSLQLVARQGSSAPGTTGTFATFTSLGLSDTKGAVIFATLNAGTGISAANNSGVWEGNSASDLALILRLGQIVDGKTITKLSFLPVLTYVNGQTRSYNSAGNLICSATFSDKTTGLVRVINGTAHVISVSATPANGTGGNYATFGNPALNDNGRVAFTATLTANAAAGITTTNNSGIWADDGTGVWQLVARTGTAAPDTSALFATLGDPVYNINQTVAFRATLKAASGQPAVTTSSTGIWSNSAGVLSLVARQGSQAPGCPVGATFATFTELALPDQGGLTNKGGAIFLATLNASAAAGVTTTSNTGIWAVDNAGALQLIIRTGDILGGKTVTTLAFLPPLAATSGTSRSTAQPNGDLSYLATFSDKSTAIFSVTF